MSAPPSTGRFAAGNQQLAVQQDTVAIVLDWQMFHYWNIHTFHGSIFILAADGHQTRSLEWTAPSDLAAPIQRLQRAGSHRTADWTGDDSGRRVTVVIPHATQLRPDPAQPKAADSRSTTPVAARTEN